MHLLDNQQYIEDVAYVANLSYCWNTLENKTVLITGATGLIGSFLIDVLMSKSEDLQCKVIAVGRNLEKAKSRFSPYWDANCFKFISCDINQGVEIGEDIVDFIFHAASNTHPVAYSNDPIGTVCTNIIGTYNLLEFAYKHDTECFVFASSVEIYGENRGDVDKFDENYCGYIDCNTLRAGYPESKRAGEALCQAYIKQKNLNVIIPRLSRTYGPTMLMSDSKAIAQFIKKGIAKEDIVLKSDGTQFYSYSYVADAVSGMLTCLFNGESGNAYNIADDNSNISLRDLAAVVANLNNKKVVFELPDSNESAGYSKATKAVLDSRKIQSLGWKAKYDITTGLKKTISILGCIDFYV